MGKKKALVVCGPTAAGKSDLADGFAEGLSRSLGARVPTLVMDSMQVYKEIPRITNQSRLRPAELVGIVSVTEEWTVARHKQRVEELVEDLRVPFVLDAGTGMYLNAIVLDVPLAPKAPDEVRTEAQRLAVGASNPRRAARTAELALMGAPQRSSIWAGETRYETALVYLRPPRDILDLNIARRSAGIVRDGAHEARELLRLRAEGLAPNPSVSEAVGVKEMMLLAAGELTAGEAEDRINARTRRLARRQIRWFDKLAGVLAEALQPEHLLVVEDPAEAERRFADWHIMHDIIGA